MKVLVVEDEPEVGGVLRDFLRELGHEAVLARSAEAALASLLKGKPDAIILDVNLPGMSGLDFLELRPIRESGLPIVAVSGVATEAQARECLRLGAVDFIAKPVAFERLREVLAYVEPHALFRMQREAAEQAERRRAPRAAIIVPARVTEYSGAEWDTYTVNMRQFGIKVRAAGDVEPGAVTKLTFAPPDGGRSIQVMSLPVRKDWDGYAFYFVNLTGVEFDRLAQLGGGLR